MIGIWIEPHERREVIDGDPTINNVIVVVVEEG